MANTYPGKKAYVIEKAYEFNADWYCIQDFDHFVDAESAYYYWLKVMNQPLRLIDNISGEILLEP